MRIRNKYAVSAWTERARSSRLKLADLIQIRRRALTILTLVSVELSCPQERVLTSTSDYCHVRTQALPMNESKPWALDTDTTISTIGPAENARCGFSVGIDRKISKAAGFQGASELQLHILPRPLSGNLRPQSRASYVIEGAGGRGFGA